MLEEPDSEDSHRQQDHVNQQIEAVQPVILRGLGIQGYVCSVPAYCTSRSQDQKAGELERGTEKRMSRIFHFMVKQFVNLH